MSLLREAIKGIRPKEETVTVEGNRLLVRGLGRVAKNDLVARCQGKSGKLDNAMLESNLLAACVCDPESQSPVMPDPADWDVPSHVSGPLVAACIRVCGFDSDEIATAEKKSDATDN